MSNPLILSVILCTYNNADSLAITLNQLVRCGVRDWNDVEILVIDNNSTDHTSSVVQAVADLSSAPLRYCFEQKQGLSSARNLGIKNARGEYLLFTDDDADIPAHWLASYLHEIQATQADCLFSRIEIIWDRSPPWWFDKRFQPFFVHLNYGEKLLKIDDIHHEFFGKNFCCRKSILESMGGFDERLGRKGASLAAGEETIIYRRLIEHGAHVVYFPSATVGHRLKPSEYSSANIEKKFVDGARSSLKTAQYFATKRIFGRPTYPIKEAVTRVFTSLCALPITLIRGSDDARRDAFFHLLQLKRALRMIKLWITTP